MLIHAVNLRITVHRIQIEMSWGDFQSNVGSLILFIIPLEPLNSFHRPYHALITGWQELMKIFPVTTSTAGNECPQTAKEVIVIAQYMRTWNFSKSLKK